MMLDRVRFGTRSALLCSLLLLASCGGGGGGGGGGGDADKLTLAPPPVPEVLATDRLHGAVAVAADTLVGTLAPLGTIVQVRLVQNDGTLGPAVATGTTDAGGHFDIPLPSGRSSADGNLLVEATVGVDALRAHAYPGAMRVDASSEGLHRTLQQSLGRVARFAADQSVELRSLHRSAALLADADPPTTTVMTVAAAADRLATRFAGDPALSGALQTLVATARLPVGLGDIGSFLGIRSDSLWIYADGSEQYTLREVTSGHSPAPGEFVFDLRTSGLDANGGIEFRHGAPHRLVGDALYGRLPSYGHLTPEESALTVALGEMRAVTLPLRPGAERVVAQSVKASGLDFTGDGKEDPFAYGRTVQVVGVEAVTVDATVHRALKVVTTEEMVFPGASGAARRLVGTTTQWLVPGFGAVRATTESRLDGQAVSNPQNLSLTRALVASVAWPGRVGAVQLPTTVGTSYCHAYSPKLRRLVNISWGYDPAYASYRTTLRMTDIDSGVEPVPPISLPGTYAQSCALDSRLVDSADGDSFYLVSSMPIPSGSGALTQGEAEQYASVIRQIRYADLGVRSEVRTPIMSHPNVAGRYHAQDVAYFSPHPSESGSFLVGTRSTDPSLTRSWMQIHRDGRWGTAVPQTQLVAATADWGSSTVHYQDGNWTVRAMNLVGDQVDASTDRALFALPCSHTRLEAGAFACILPHRRYSASTGSLVGELPYEVEQHCRYRSPYVYCWRGYGWDRLQRRDPVTLALVDEIVVGSDLRARTGAGLIGDLDRQGSNQFIVLSGSEFIFGYARISVGAWK